MKYERSVSERAVAGSVLVFVGFVQIVVGVEVLVFLFALNHVAYLFDLADDSFPRQCGVQCRVDQVTESASEEAAEQRGGTREALRPSFAAGPQPRRYQ